MESANEAQCFVIHSQSGTPSNQATSSLAKPVGTNRLRATSSLGHARVSARRHSGETPIIGKRSVGARRGSSASSPLRVPAKGPTLSPPSPPLLQQRELLSLTAQLPERDHNTQEVLANQASSPIVAATVPSSPGHLRQENEELRLKVEALNDEIQWSTENYWQVISTIIAERNKLEENLEQQRHEARALEERYETMQQELQAKVRHAAQLPEPRPGIISCLPAQQFCHTPICREFSAPNRQTSVRLSTPTPIRLTTCSVPVPAPTWTSFSHGSQTPVVPAYEFQWPFLAPVEVPCVAVAPATSCRRFVYLAASCQGQQGQPAGLLQRLAPVSVREASVAPSRTVIRAPSSESLSIKGPKAEVASVAEPKEPASAVVSVENKDPQSDDLKSIVSKLPTPLRRGRKDRVPS